MKIRFIALLAVFAGTGWAQLSGYLGPGVLTRGASNIGQRSGQDVDLRFYANAQAIYDTGLTPVSVNSSGSLTNVGALAGVQVGLGAYGRHQWRRAVLGLDYTGNYRHYSGNTFYNGTNQALALGYTYQKSRRVVFDMQTVAGTANYATSFVSVLPQVYDTVVDQTTLLFDNRVNYIQGGMDVNFLLSSRTVFSAGGSAYKVDRHSKALIGLNGYNIHGSLQHRLSQVTTIGVTYQRIHYDYPRAFGESNLNLFQAQFARQFGRSWTLSLSGGVFVSEVQGVRRVAVDPAISQLLGVMSTIEVYYRQNRVPSGSVSVTHNWRYASWNVNYRRGINSGNGVFLTSRQESYGSTFSYTGLRKWSFSLNLSHSKLASLGQTLSQYSQYYGTSSVSYKLTQVINLSASYTYRHADTANNSFRRNSSRTMFSIYFSPGNIPISFH